MRVQQHAISIVFAGLLGLPHAALAQSPSVVSGSWRAGSTAIEVAIESWGADCGPRPQSTRSSGGGLVNVEQREQVLLVHGRDQDIRSDSCWSRNPAMKRINSSVQGGVWVTRCQTAKNDPRAEQGTYTLKLVSDDTLLYQDVSHYDWALNTSKCVATFTTTQTLSRSAKDRAEPAKSRSPAPAERPERIETPTPASSAQTAAATVPPVTAEERACTPGAPARLTLRPRRVEIEVGQRICFKPRLADASDCAIKNPALQWSLSHSKALRGSLSGACFNAAESAAEAQGEFRVTASVGHLSADAFVAVKPIDLSALIATRMESGGLTGFDDEPAAPTSAPKAVARIATHTSTQAEGGGRKLLLLGLGALAVALAGLGFWYSRRMRPAAEGGESEPALAGISAAPSSPAAASRSAASDTPWICPTCRVGYPAQQGTCPKDGTKLMPYAEFAKRGRRHDEEHTKRCPECGSTFPASASFCGADGSSLVDT
jgi:hypothetical protein